MNEAVIVQAVRTPFGKRGGASGPIRGQTIAMRGDGPAAAGRAAGERVDDLIAGCVSQAGERRMRLAAMLAGSGDGAWRVAEPHVRVQPAGRISGPPPATCAVIAGGVESMSRVPMFLDVTLGQGVFRGFDTLNPALLQRYPLVHQIESAERIAEHWG